jgi:hypothetical protein
MKAGAADITSVRKRAMQFSKERKKFQLQTLFGEL